MGVCMDKAKGKWTSYISVKRPQGGLSKHIGLGRSTTEQEAAERVSAAAYLLGDKCAAPAAWLLGGRARRAVCARRARPLEVCMVARACARAPWCRCASRDVPVDRYAALTAEQGAGERGRALCGGAPAPAAGAELLPFLSLACV